MPIDDSNAPAVAVDYTIYNGYDNVVEHSCTLDGVVQDLEDITGAKLIEEEGEFIIDSDESASAFDFTSATEGLLQLQLGHEDIAEGIYTCWLVLIDAVNTNGRVLGTITFEFVDI
jgi:hypothetical protein